MAKKNKNQQAEEVTTAPATEVSTSVEGSEETSEEITFPVQVDENMIPLISDENGRALLTPDGDRLPKSIFNQHLTLSDLNGDGALIAQRRKLARIAYHKYMSLWYANQASDMEANKPRAVSIDKKIDRVVENLRKHLMVKFGGDTAKVEAALQALT